jgi:hypothetical protein
MILLNRTRECEKSACELASLFRLYRATKNRFFTSPIALRSRTLGQANTAYILQALFCVPQILEALSQWRAGDEVYNEARMLPETDYLRKGMCSRHQGAQMLMLLFLYI